MAKKPRRRRVLSEEEHALWRKVADSVERREPVKMEELSITPPPVLHPVPAPIRIKPFQVGQNANLKNGSAGRAVSRGAGPAAVREMDKRQFEKLRRGKLKVEGKLDLHGMTVAQAGPALTRFVGESVISGRRLLLVITGKGRQRDDFDMVPQQTGVLRRQVPLWLTMPPLSHNVLQVTEAHAKHGGGGAYYVYLRRQR